MLERVDKEKNIDELATTEPSDQNATATPILGLAILSLMCGTKAMLSIAAIETML